jgi:hypothetical protein
MSERGKGAGVYRKSCVRKGVFRASWEILAGVSLLECRKLRGKERSCLEGPGAPDESKRKMLEHDGETGRDGDDGNVSVGEGVAEFRKGEAGVWWTGRGSGGKKDAEGVVGGREEGLECSRK